MLERRGHVALISGANRGIGRAIAERLAGEGWRLALGLRRPDSAAPLPGEVLVQPYDAAAAGGAPAWVAATLARWGRIDAVIANAGIWLPARLADGDPAAVEAMWQVNALAPLQLVQAAWEPLKASGAGRFLAVASLSGKRATGPNVGYAMSKFALVGLTQQVRRDGWEHGIRATALCPGFVATDMAATATAPRAPRTQPEDLAELVATLLRLPNSATVGELMVNWRLEAGF